ncbi:MAG TPA: dienelactone hydrolase family protein [Chitinophagaceae bacterium]|nr:dienelactone hydrolase family protein [Chitinophagaceae bacterium]
MKRYTLLFACSIALIVLIYSCNSNDDTASDSNTKTETKAPKLKDETVNYTVDSLRMQSYVVYDENVEGKRPAVLVIHEWWGLNDYAKRRANMLAEMGYIAMAVDMYGNGRMGNDPGAAQALAMPFYQDPAMAKKHFDMALAELKKNPNVDQSKIAGIGYCFGGGILLNLARMGEPLNGVVSFHGSLLGTPADKNLTKAEILVCHGEKDDFVNAEVAPFKKQMDSIGKSYTFKTYPGATHAFTNPDATEMGKKFNMPIEYNAAADSASWNDMKDFFARIFKQ